MPNIRQMEDDVVGRFTAEVNKRFLALHATGRPLPYAVGTALSGQDHDLADYLLGARGRFALIEFKADRRSTLTELDKKPRLQLLESCRLDSGILRRSLNIHHFGWERLERRQLPQIGSQLVATIEVARYIPELASAAQVRLPLGRARLWDSNEFITSFFEVQSAGTNIHRFRRYLSELYAIVGKSGSSALGRFEGTVLVYVPDLHGTAQIQTIRFKGFDQLMELTINYEKALTKQNHRPPPEQSRDQGLSM